MTDFNDNSAASPPVTALAPKPVAHPTKLQPAAAPQLYKQALDWQRALKSNTLGNVLPGALAGLTVGTYGGALYLDATHNRRVPAKEEQARNRKVLGRSALGGILLGGLAGAGLGYHQDVMDGLREMTWAAEDAATAGHGRRRWEEDVKRRAREWAAGAKRESDARVKERAQQWADHRARVVARDAELNAGPGAKPTSYMDSGSIMGTDTPGHPSSAARDPADPQAARRVGTFLAQIGRPGVDQSKLRQIMESFPEGSDMRRHLVDLFTQRFKTAAIQDTLRRYGL